MENIALSRRNFIKLLGVGSLTALTGIGLTGCAENDDIQSIDLDCLGCYDIVICDYFQNTRCVITGAYKSSANFWFRLYQPGDTLKY